jgi:hypothetical protein
MEIHILNVEQIRVFLARAGADVVCIKGLLAISKCAFARAPWYLRTLQFLRLVSFPRSPVECPHKPNLLSVGLLICRVSGSSGGKTQQISFS